MAGRPASRCASRSDSIVKLHHRMIAIGLLDDDGMQHVARPVELDHADGLQHAGIKRRERQGPVVAVARDRGFIDSFERRAIAGERRTNASINASNSG